MYKKISPVTCLKLQFEWIGLEVCVGVYDRFLNQPSLIFVDMNHE